MSHAKKIAENAAWLVIANTAQKAVSFIAFTIIARLVGVEITGVYFFAVSITSIFVVFQDLGLTPVVIREMAADESRGRHVLGQALRLKLLLIPVTVVATLAYAFFTGITGTTFLAVAMACYVMSADSVHLIWYGAIRGKRELRYEAAGMFVGQILTAIIGISAAYLGYGVLGLVFSLMVGSTWHVGWSISRALKLGLYPQSGSAPLQKLLQAAIPFGLAGIFVKIYSYVDSIMLQRLHGSVDVGEYAVAYKLTYALQFLPLAFVAALYPGMSNAAQNDRAALPSLLKGSLRLMMIAAVPLSALLSSLAYIIVPILYGKQFEGSIAPLMVLPWVLIPIFLDFPIGSLLNATHRAAQKTFAMGVTMIVNVVANALLIPSMGPAGAAWAGVVSFVILFALGWWFARSDIDSPWLSKLLAQGLGAAGLTWLAVYFLTPVMTPIFAILFAGAISLVSLFLFRLLLVNDVQTAYIWLRRRISPPPTEDEEFHDKP
ncbi:flippase [Candidatus Uhrbacteria bacterium]|nr:MAG: flippase [Candidatus Uhrbacteria bacterium]